MFAYVYLILLNIIHFAPIASVLAQEPTETDWLQSIFSALVNALLIYFDPVIKFAQAITNTITWIVEAIVGIVTWLAEGIGTILSFFGNLIIQVVNGILTVIGGLITGVLMFVYTITAFIIDVVLNIVKVVHIVSLTLDVVVPLAGRVISYFFQAMGILTGMITGVSNAAPQAIPGLPQCVTAPMESQICAMWYVFDWTILAPGTPGAYIVPIIVLMIDLTIIVYVGSSIFKLVRWFQGVYKVA